MIYIGTSGWHYNHWRGPFYPERLAHARMLEAYTNVFRTVELNNTFYRLPTPRAVSEWRDSTPSDFCFAVKGSRFLTHMKKLNDAEAGLARFLERVEPLGPKLGPILFQLPPHWPVNLERLDAFLKILPRYHRYAFEFREPSWNCEPVYALLRKRNIGYCIFHLAGFQSPLEVTASFTFIRLHGPGDKYQGSYSDADLKQWAARIRRWKLDDAYIYFDNDQAGYAPQNARRLQEILGPR